MPGPLFGPRHFGLAGFRENGNPEDWGVVLIMRAAVSVGNLGPRALAQVQAQLAQEQVKKRPKYGNKRVAYKNRAGIERIYDSIAEARYAETLDNGIRAGLISWWLPQVPFPLPGNKKYRADFMVRWLDGETRVIDVKGMDNPLSRLKRDQVKALYGIDVEIVQA